MGGLPKIGGRHRTSTHDDDDDDDGDDYDNDGDDGDDGKDGDGDKSGRTTQDRGAASHLNNILVMMMMMTMMTMTMAMSMIMIMTRVKGILLVKKGAKVHLKSSSQSV